MAIFKCKMCGGALEIVDKQSVAVCEYCGTKQTLPKLDDEKRVQLYDRANYFRRENEFDKAMGIYEMILGDDKEDCESYWGIVLCRYGIEYVEDPRMHKRIPTVNRAQFTSIFDDEDYKNAIKFSDVLQKEVYEAEASVIDKIQKGILAISQREEPFDVFICYKETDKSGNRTQDSVYAQDIYNALTKEGYKVFFSRITLEDKLGSAYEPYIFAALNTARVMLVIGTEKENFNAVWVKNEWSRYLSLIKAGKEKTLIPVYKDISPYDMPEEFQYLQAQDMGKIGFVQDLLHGIGKLVEVNKTTVKETVVVNNANANAAPLLKRAYMFLEDGDFERADEFCEQVLNIDPECAEAYLGKLMVSLSVREQQDLKNVKEPFDDRDNYRKVLRFADEDLKNELSGYIKFIKERNENARLQSIYSSALNTMNTTDSEKMMRLCAEKFKSISNYKNSKELAEACLEKEKEIIYTNAKKDMDKATSPELLKAVAEIFNNISDYKDSENLKSLCIERAEFLRKDNIYNQANQVFSESHKWAGKHSDFSAYKNAEKMFSGISGWRDSDEKAQKCREKAQEIEDAIKAEEAERDRKEEQERKKEKTAEKIRKIVAIVIIVSIILCTIGSVLYYAVIKPAIVYRQAIELYNEEQYMEAYSKFKGSYDYKDSELYCSKIMKKLVAEDAISAGASHTVGLKTDGTVVAVGDNDYSQCDVESWTNIVAISAGDSHTVGLKSDGTVVAVGDNDYSQCDVEGWTDIVTISAGKSHTVGLKSDGTVVAVGYNYYSQCDTESWRDIVAISAGDYHTVGLKADGTVVAVGDNYYSQYDVESWTDIVAISAGDYHTVGLKADGTVVAIGDNDFSQCDVESWTDIVAISAGDYHTVGLKSDGTVVAVGFDYYSECDVESWTDIVAISTSDYHTVGLKADGTVVAVGNNYFSQCDVEGWKDIKIPE